MDKKVTDNDTTVTDKNVLTQKYKVGEMVHVTYESGDTGIGKVCWYYLGSPYPGEYQINVIPTRVGVFRDDQIRKLTKLERALT